MYKKLMILWLKFIFFKKIVEIFEYFSNKNCVILKN